MLTTRLLLLSLLLVGTGMFSLLQAQTEAKQDRWSHGDMSEFLSIDPLISASKFDEAKAIVERLLIQHPENTVLMARKSFLLHRLGDDAGAVAVMRRAYAIDPSDAYTQAYLGKALYQAGAHEEALIYLEKARQTAGPDFDLSAGACLVAAYRQTKGDAFADATLDELISRVEPDDAVRQYESLMYTSNELGQSAQALAGLRRVASRGNQTASSCLHQFYGNGWYGIAEDDGESLYWARRSGEMPLLFPPWKESAVLIEATHGWFLVAVALLLACGLPSLTLSLFARPASRGVTKDPAIHWAERARRNYGFKLYLGMWVILCVIQFALIALLPSTLLPVPVLVVQGVALVLSVLLTCRQVLAWTKLYSDEVGTYWETLQILGTSVVLMLFPISAVAVMSYVMPTQWGWQAALYLIVFVIAYFSYLRWGGINLRRLMGRIRPADPELKQMAEAQAAALKIKVPQVYLLQWRVANAWAFIYSNTIMVTTKLREKLSREEISTVLAHEMGHLMEPLAVKVLRILPIFVVVLPVVTIPLWMDWMPTGLFVWLGIFLVTSFAVRILSRRMEVRADRIAASPEQAATYARALCRLYELNDMPAVMASKRMMHPHLYDRMLAAGVTPDFSRPEPPSLWAFRWCFPACLLLNVLIPVFIWMVLI